MSAGHSFKVPQDSPMAATTIDVPLGSLTTYNLLELCPPGYLPKCVTRQLVYSAPSQTASVAVSPPYPAGTRIRFHFRTTSVDTGALIDDTHLGIRSKPMELVIGRGFILEIWEVALNTMKEGEVVKFMVPKELCREYPTVARIKRNLSKRREEKILSKTLSEICQSNDELIIEEEGTGHQDLDAILTTPQDLSFVLEVLEVSLPGEYSLEILYNAPVDTLTSAQTSYSDMEDSILSVERKADKLLVSREYQDAATMYSSALDRIDQLFTPEESEQKQKKRISLLMKTAYCKLNSKSYPEALALLTSILEINADNAVALFRRGRCHVQIRNFDQARIDFARALELDQTYQKAVRPELAIIEAEERKLNTT